MIVIPQAYEKQALKLEGNKTFERWKKLHGVDPVSVAHFVAEHWNAMGQASIEASEDPYRSETENRYRLQYGCTFVIGAFSLFFVRDAPKNVIERLALEEFPEAYQCARKNNCAAEADAYAYMALDLQQLVKYASQRP